MAGSSNTYKVGLHNAGSYQVSGRPWLKTNAIADEEVQYYLLPNVSKTLHVCNDHNAASHDMLVAFPEPRMAANLLDTGNNNFTATFDAQGTLTVSGWFKYEDLSGNARLLDLTDASNNSKVRIQNSGDKLRIVPNGNGGAAQNTPAGVIVLGEWHHFVVTVTRAGSDISLYVDGSLRAQVTAVAVDADVEKIALGHHSGTNFDGLYSDIFLFDDVLIATEARDLFDGVGNIDPREHSRASNLISWWAFENNTHKDYFTPADTGTTVFDRISSNDLTLSAGGTGTLSPVTYEIGRHAYSIFNESKCYILSGQEQADFNFKTSLVAVKAVGGSLDYSIYGSLTGIPASRLRGTGLYD